jgi:CRP/FNR family cyclic AMP-dependent transcriptional regulator
MTSGSTLTFDPKDLLAKITEGKTIFRPKMNEKIFSRGDAADSIFYIQEGKVKLTVISEQKKEAIIAILEAGAFCGEGCLGGQPIRMATAIAIEECEIIRIEKATMIRLLHDEPDFSESFVSYLVMRNIRVEADLVDQLFNSTEKRLARLLVIMAKFGNEGKHVRVIPKMSQETLAEMIGTTRHRVNFFMNKFRRMGLVSYNGRLEIHSSLLDVILLDEPHIKT